MTTEPTTRKKAVNGRAKGAVGERELAKILSASLGGTFIRSNNSGAFVGGKNVHRKKGIGSAQMMGLKGDLCPPDELARLVVESKVYKAGTVSYEKMVVEPVAKIDSWINQAVSSIDPGDLWMVCWRVDRQPWMVIVDREELGPTGPFNVQLAPFATTYTTALGRRCTIMELDAFLRIYGDDVRRRCAPALSPSPTLADMPAGVQGIVETPVI